MGLKIKSNVPWCYQCNATGAEVTDVARHNGEAMNQSSSGDQSITFIGLWLNSRLESGVMVMGASRLLE